jgi:HlyD family secretion protein
MGVVMMSRTKFKLIFMVVISALVFSGCAANDSQADKTKFQGTIEAKDVDINAKVAGRLLEVKVEEGQSVKRGDVIAVIDAKDLAAKRQGMVAQAQAAKAGVDAAKAQYEAVRGQLHAAEAACEKAKNGARSQDIAKAKAAYDMALKSYKRVKVLAESGYASIQQLDEAKAGMTVALQDWSMAKEGARKEDVNVARSQVEAVRASLSAAKSNIAAATEKYKQSLAGIQEVDTYIADSAIKAPMGGLVTMVNSSGGELVSTGLSIAGITDMKDIWVEINVPETELSKFSEGQILKVSVPAYKEKVFDGEVVRINEKPDYAVKKASNENGDFDIVSYGVKVRLSNDGNMLRPGMTAFANVLDQ